MKFKPVLASNGLAKRILVVMMRSYIFLLCTTVFSFSHFDSFSQQSVIIKTDKSVSVDEVFNIIKRQTNYTFIYQKGIFKDFPNVQLKKGAIKLGKLLNKSLSGGDYGYMVTQEQTIIIRKKDQINSIPRSDRGDQSLQYQINGTVTDSHGTPLPGASIIEQGTTNGTQTDFDGNFSLNVTDENAILVISYIGFATQEITVGGQRNIQVVLLESTDKLDEVIVVGYGTEKVANITSGIGYVSGEVLENRPVANLAQGLQGAVAGLNITNSGGRPGATPSINIRGWSGIGLDDDGDETSIKAEPLVLIDGVPGDMNLLNPQDVSNISVLKDAAAASIYGARAANGVILITTKKGRSGKTRININTSVAMLRPGNLPQFAKSSEYIEALMEGGLTDFTYWYNSPSVSMDQWLQFVKLHEQNPERYPKLLLRREDGNFLFTGSEDYVSQTVKKATFLQNHDFNISGGSDMITYFGSLGFLDQKGVFKLGNDEYTRLNATLSLNIKPKDWMDFAFRLRYSNTHNNQPNRYGSQEVWNNLYRTPHYRALVNDQDKIWQWNESTGQYEVTPYEPTGNYIWDNNALANLALGGRDIRRTNDLVLTVAPTFKVGRNLNIKGDFTYNPTFYQRNYYWKKIDYEILRPGNITNYITSPDFYNKANDYDRYYVFNAYAEYEKTFGDKHYVKALAGYNQEWADLEHTEARRQNVLVSHIPEVALGDQFGTFGADHWAARASFYRLNYAYDNKYFFKTTGRYDGTSKFPKANRFGFFPSVELGWKVSNESFMDSTDDVLSNLMLRFSYGELGNQFFGNSNNHPYESRLNESSRTSFLINGQRPPSITIPGNLPAAADITWEVSKTKNFGVDLGFFQNRLNVNFDYFIKDVEGLLRQRLYSALLGVTGPRENLASVRNKGWEFNLEFRDRIGEDFSYFINANVSDFVGKVTEIDNPSGTLSTFYKGQTLGEIWGYKSSIFQTDEEAATANPGGSNDQSVWRPSGGWQAGDIKYHDLNGDGVVDFGAGTIDDHGDRTIIGNTSPRYRYAFTLGAEYKGFDLRTFFQGVGKREFRPNGAVFQPVNSRWGNHLRKWQLDAWSPDNPDAYLPRYTTQQDYNFSAQSRFIQNAAYLRLKNLTFGYTLPDKVLEKLGMEKIRLYFLGENLWETTKLKVPWDPEATDGFSGGSGKSYPFQRTYTLGVNLTF